MRSAGVETVVDSADLSVVGLVEVVSHLPRIYGQFRRLIGAAERQRPDLAILTDSPDFNLRVARKVKKLGIPVIYFVAPQVWAWREGRIRQLRQHVDILLCIFPFEESYFRARGVAAQYVGHPLTRVVRPSLGRDEFFRKHGLDPARHLITLLPGSRIGEVARHLPAVAGAARLLSRSHRPNLVLATPLNFTARAGSEFFRERIDGSLIQVIEGETWDSLAHADVGVAASGTVTVEAAILGTPVVTFYSVSGISWLLGRLLVRVPYYTMVNLVAGRRIVPELMQEEATGERIAAEAAALLENYRLRDEMKRDLAAVASKLATAGDPAETAARIVSKYLKRDEH
jgi:lipid-A-disaccharide synthase